MSERDSKGRYIKGSKNTIEEYIKKMYSLQESWKSRKDYIGDIKSKYPRIYNSWRACMFTKKGKQVGISEDWKDFRNFYNDVQPSYQQGKIFRRLDSTKPFSKDNFIWVTNEEAILLKSTLITLTYNGKTLYLKQWAEELNRSIAGIKKRYYNREKYNYNVEEILLGRTKKRGSKIVKDSPNIRAKLSRMISSYKIKDRKNGISICDLNIDWMLTNIVNKPCYYCGDTHRIGCDRIDNSKGHTKDNVIPCCYEYNCARNNNFSVEEMKIIGQAIKKVKENRNNHLNN